MYAHCHLCRHGLGRNTLIAHMPIGGRLGYDPERGRLWVVCSACGEWNLTPLEGRWEVIEECERHFQAAEARASSANVGVSRLSGLDLIRIGPALRDEVANWRYGPRFGRRRRRARVTAGATGVVGLAAVGGAAALGILSSGFAIGLWGTALAASYVVPLLAPLTRQIGPGRDITFVDPAVRSFGSRTPPFTASRSLAANGVAVPRISACNFPPLEGRPNCTRTVRFSP